MFKKNNISSPSGENLWTVSRAFHIHYN